MTIETSDKDKRILLAHKVFQLEKAIFQARRDVEAAQSLFIKKREIYEQAVSTACGLPLNQLQFSHSMCCFGTKLISHCVWDIRTRWPLCIFCGSPRDGD